MAQRKELKCRSWAGIHVGLAVRCWLLVATLSHQMAVVSPTVEATQQSRWVDQPRWLGAVVRQVVLSESPVAKARYLAMRRFKVVMG